MAAYEQLVDYLKETGVVHSCGRLLGWDQQTYMPKGGAELRARQLATLAVIEHRRKCAPEFGELLAQASAATPDADSPAAANIREARRDHDRATRVPPELVEERTRTHALAQGAWVEARKKDDFALFRPWLEKVVDLARRYADALGYEDQPYDALLDEWEPGETTAQLNELFAPLREAHVALVGKIVDAGRSANGDLLHKDYAIAAQDTFARRVAQDVGFDFDRGRIDLTVHPFCSGQAPGDVRITTRWDKNNFADGFFSVLHEVGHGLYEQGLPDDAHGTPLGEACSLGIHESQSRLWENFVGRSRGFWQHFYPAAQEEFTALRDIALDDYWRAINDVKPSFIRVDADEVTYNLHIFLRFELEQLLINGGLDVADLPAAWNERFTQSFRLTPPTDREGCLQDIHWSAGALGYFPTYTIGNVYAALLYRQAEAELGDLEEQFARGEFQPLLGWLGRKIHARGRHYPPRRLIEEITGTPPSPAALIAHLEQKYSAVYGL